MGQQPAGSSTIIGVTEMARQGTPGGTLSSSMPVLRGRECGMKHPILFTGVPRSCCEAFDRAERAPSGPGKEGAFDTLVLEEERSPGGRPTLPRSLSAPDAIVDGERGGVAESPTLTHVVPATKSQERVVPGPARG